MTRKPWEDHFASWPLKQRYASLLPTQSFIQHVSAILQATIPINFSRLYPLKWPYMTTVLYNYRTQWQLWDAILSFNTFVRKKGLTQDACGSCLR